MRILALDVATCTGFAQWASGQEWPTYGSQKFVAADLAVRATLFVDWLLPLLSAQGTTDIGIEAPVPVRGLTNLDTLVWLYGCYWRVREIAERRRITVWPVGVAQWRSCFLGLTFAPKSIDRAKRSQWLKRRCVDECRARGYAPKDDNAADAIGILEYVRCMTDEDFARASRPQLRKVAA